MMRYRIEAFEPPPRIVGGKLPVDRGLEAIAGGLPCGALAAQNLDAFDAAVQALTDHDVALDFGDVQPTAMLGGADEREAIPQGLGLVWWKGFAEGAGPMGGESVHDQGDGCGVLVTRGDVGQELRSVTLVTRLPARGSVAMKTLQVPQRQYS